jgi:hypothetical protein
LRASLDTFGGTTASVTFLGKTPPHRLLERLVQGRVHEPYSPSRKPGVELGAVEALHVHRRQRLEPGVPQSRHQVQPHHILVVLQGPLLDGPPDRVLQPPLQVFFDSKALIVEDETALPVRECPRELLRFFASSLLRYLDPRLAVDGPPLAPLGRVDSVLGHPPAVLAAADAALSVSSLTHIRFSPLPFPEHV